jgi:uncharacterized protein YecT (DUF1311 family)
VIAAIVLAAAAATPCGTTQTQRDLDVCWGGRAMQADSQLRTTYATVLSEMRRLRLGTKSLTGTQAAWDTARTTTCDFEESLYEGGSIAPMMNSQCVDRMTRARSDRLRAIFRTLVANRSAPALRPVSVSAAAELKNVYGLLYKRVTPAQQKSLAASERAWTLYRDAACTLEGGGCLTDLALQRTLELKSGWIGEPFW